MFWRSDNQSQPEYKQRLNTALFSLLSNRCRHGSIRLFVNVLTLCHSPSKRTFKFSSCCEEYWGRFTGWGSVSVTLGRGWTFLRRRFFVTADQLWKLLPPAFLKYGLTSDVLSLSYSVLLRRRHVMFPPTSKLNSSKKCILFPPVYCLYALTVCCRASNHPSWM